MTMRIIHVATFGAAAVVFGPAGVVEGFATPPTTGRQTITTGRAWVTGRAVEASRTDMPASGPSRTGPSIVADRTRDIRNSMRDAIWKATDAMTHAVEDLPNIVANSNDTLTRLGNVVESIDEKYFSKYWSEGSTLSYSSAVDSGSGTATLERGVGGGGGGGVGTAGSPKDKKPNKDGKKLNTKADAASAVSSSASKKASEAVDTIAENAKGEVDDAGKTQSTKSGSATGTVKLDRPQKVQDVFDDLQKKAVDYYKKDPVAQAAKDAAGLPTPLPLEVQELENKLESLLKDSNFKPRKLGKKKRSQLVQTLKAMESAYPADASPLEDPSLSGQWSVVYSSSSRVIGRALRGILSKLFKASDARQVIDSQASSIINACRARLRLTPLAMRVAQKASYRMTADRKVAMDFPRQKGGLGGLLPRLRSGKVKDAEVTYLSSRWRICRAGGVTVAFRKNERKQE